MDWRMMLKYADMIEQHHPALCRLMDLLCELLQTANWTGVDRQDKYCFFGRLTKDGLSLGLLNYDEYDRLRHMLANEELG